MSDIYFIFIANVIAKFDICSRITSYNVCYTKLLRNKLNQVTGSDGTARFGLPSGGIGLLIARQGDDTAILPGNTYYWEPSNS